MLVCWSGKGGSGTTVVSVLIAIAFHRATSERVVLADLAGDVPVALGHDEHCETGLRQWMESDTDVPAQALRRLAFEVVPGLDVIPTGNSAVGSPQAIRQGQGARLAAALRGTPSVVDAGLVHTDFDIQADVVRQSDHSLLVIRPCYLALRRLCRLEVRPTGVVLVDEPGRALDGRDVEDVLGVPVMATLKWDASLARAVDAGRLARRAGKLGRSLEALTNLVNSGLPVGQGA